MPIIIVVCGIPHIHSLNEATIMQKFLAAFFVVAGFTLPLTYGVAQAEPVSKTAKKPARQAATTTQDSEAISVAGLTSSQYSCELGNKFTVYKKFGWDVFNFSVIILGCLAKIFREVGGEVPDFFHAMYVGGIGVVPVGGFTQ